MDAKLGTIVLMILTAAVTAVTVITLTPEPEIPFPTGDAERVEAALLGLTDRITRLEVKLDRPRVAHDPQPGGATAPSAAPGAKPGTDPLVPGPTDPARAKGTPLAKPLTEMTPQQLLKKGLCSGPYVMPPADRLPYLDELLSRSLENEFRAKALLQRGIALRTLGDYSAATDPFTEMANLVPGTNQAAESSFQLAWTCRYQKDYRGAITHYQSACDNPAVRDAFKAGMGLQIADCHIQLEDTASARNVLETLVRDHKDAKDPNIRQAVERARVKLAGLK